MGRPSSADIAAIRAIAEAIAAATQPGAHHAAAQVAHATIVGRLRGLGLPSLTARVLADRDAATQATPSVPLSTAMATARDLAPSYRAAYLVAAAHRLAGTRGLAELDALNTERRYFRQHVNAQTAREQGAARLDAAAHAYGSSLGWYARHDGRTTPECRAANGHNFDPAHPPRIGLPGTGPHVGCRCLAGPPHAGAGSVDAATVGVHDTIAASQESAVNAVELAAAKTLPNGDRVVGDGVTYDPKTNSFHATTAAESGFNAKHPRAAKGGPAGGQFVKAQKQQAAAQKKQQAATAAAAKHQAAAAKKAAAQRQATTQNKQRTAAAAKHATTKPSATTNSTAAGPTGKTPRLTAKTMTTPVPGGPSQQALTAAMTILTAQHAALTRNAAVTAAPGVVHNPAIPPAVLAAAAAQIAARTTTQLAHPEQPATELSAKTATYSTVHSPLGDPAGPGLWHHKGWQMPAYIQNVAKGIITSGVPRSRAIAIAVGKIRDWAEGKGDVSPEVRAASVKAIAEWDALRARTKVTDLTAEPSEEIVMAAGPHRYRHGWILIAPGAGGHESLADKAASSSSSSTSQPKTTTLGQLKAEADKLGPNSKAHALYQAALKRNTQKTPPSPGKPAAKKMTLADLGKKLPPKTQPKTTPKAAKAKPSPVSAAHKKTSLDGLSTSQLDALKLYTGDDYKGINDSLRGGKIPAKYTPAVASIDSALAAKPLAEPAKVWRTVGGGAFGLSTGSDATALKGKVFTEAGFMSTSVKNQRFPVKPPPVHLTIEVPPGVGAAYLEQITNNVTENELLLQRNLRYVVTNVRYSSAKGGWTATARVLPGSVAA